MGAVLLDGCGDPSECRVWSARSDIEEAAGQSSSCRHRIVGAGVYERDMLFGTTTGGWCTRK